MSIVAVLGIQRKRLLGLFKKLEATSVEKAVTLQEIVNKWDILGIKTLRMRNTEKHLNFLARRGKI